MNKQPLVSVIMPVFNAGMFLKPAIESIINQTYQRFELIIVDDASTDTSAAVIAHYKTRYPDKIKVMTMTKNLNGGGDICANEGVKKARGRYIARMDADDIAHKKRLEKQVAFLEENSNVFLVGSSAHVIDKKGKITGEKLEPSNPHDIYTSYFTFHPLIHPSCMLRRKINGKKFEYKLSYSANNDYLTFFTLLCKGAIFVNLPDKLIYYRMHGKNDTFVHMKQKFLNIIKIRYEMLTKFGYRPTLKSLLINLIQAILFLFLPEKVLLNMYLASKGILYNQEIKIPLFKHELFTFNPYRLLGKKMAT